MLNVLARHALAIRELPLVTGFAEEFRPFCAIKGWQEPTPGCFVIEEPVQLWAPDAEDYDDVDDACPARVVLHRWEDWDVDDHPSEAEWIKACQNFDDLYDRTSDLLGQQWGEAIAKGCCTRDDRRFRWALWPGAGGLRILAQDDPDIQFGIEIDIWLLPWREGDDLPEMPLF